MIYNNCDIFNFTIIFSIKCFLLCCVKFVTYTYNTYYTNLIQYIIFYPVWKIKNYVVLF